MMWNILVYLNAGFQLAKLCPPTKFTLFKPNKEERSEKIIPPPTAWCAHGSWSWSDPNISCWFWADAVWELAFIYFIHPSLWLQASTGGLFLCLSHAINSGAAPLLLILILELSHPRCSSPLLPSPHTLHRAWQTRSAPRDLPKPLQGSDTGFGCDW